MGGQQRVAQRSQADETPFRRRFQEKERKAHGSSQRSQRGPHSQYLQEQFPVFQGNQRATGEEHEDIERVFGQAAGLLIGARPGQAEQNPGGQGEESEQKRLACEASEPGRVLHQRQQGGKGNHAVENLGVEASIGQPEHPGQERQITQHQPATHNESSSGRSEEPGY
ncbi:hypothetical protein FQZ97_1058530 [compost metagenome]